MLVQKGPWCSWLTYFPVTEKIAGSSPVGLANFFNMPRFSEPSPKAYSQEYYKELLEEGHSHLDAIKIASTEMDGADENPDGTINSKQTACNFLKYSETMAPSITAQEAARVAKNAAEAEARKLGFPDLKTYYESLGLDAEDL